MAKVREKIPIQFINVTRVKKFALRYAKDTRLGWTTKQVSHQFLVELDTKVRNLITHAIAHHPSRGVTIRDFI